MDSKYIITTNGNFVSEDELYHHGIKGMKWGVRRYQNPDGTLTSAGKKRYSSSDDPRKMSTDELRQKVNRLNNEQRYMELTKSSSSGVSKAAEGIERGSKTAGDINKVYKATKGENNPYSKVAGQTIDTASRTARLAKKIDNSVRTKKDAKEALKKLEKMSDAELAKEVDRLNLEQQYSRLQSSNVRRGKTRVSDVLDVAGDVVAIGASAVAIAVGIQKLMNK
nr:MAG TPA: hypothetical protein [Caudoviricetes sp.]